MQYPAAMTTTYTAAKNSARYMVCLQSVSNACCDISIPPVLWWPCKAQWLGSAAHKNRCHSDAHLRNALPLRLLHNVVHPGRPGVHIIDHALQPDYLL